MASAASAITSTPIAAWKWSSRMARLFEPVWVRCQAPRPGGNTTTAPGPYVDGLFSQGNFGVVTKMGFHLLPAPEAYLTGTVIVPKRNDIIPLVEGGNRLEHAGVIGMPEYGSPLGGFGGPADPELRSLLAKPGGAVRGRIGAARRKDESRIL